MKGLEIHSAHYKFSKEILDRIREKKAEVLEKGVESYGGQPVRIRINKISYVQFAPEVLKEYDAEAVFHSIIKVEESELGDTLRENGNGKKIIN